MIYKVHLTFTPFQELCHSFLDYDDMIDFLGDLSTRDDLSQIYVSKVSPSWYNMTEAF